MALDKNNVFSDAQAITANATTVASTDLIDLGALVDDRSVALNQYGPENGKLWLHVSIGVAPTAGTGIQCELQDCATAGGTYKNTGIGVNDAIPNATLVAGYSMLKVPLMPGLRRFIRVLYTTTGDHTASVGTINARLEWGSKSDDVVPYRA